MISSYIKIKNKLYNVLINKYPEIQTSNIYNEQWSNIELTLIDDINISQQQDELILTDGIKTWLILNHIIKNIEKNKYQIIIGRCKIF